MKKYIAPEMEIAKFAAEDIITTSTPVTIEPAANSTYNFSVSQDAEYGTF